MYEFSTFSACTGFLVRNENGTVMHGRNLDFEMWELLSKLLVNVEYYKDGKKLYAVDTVAASVFALTGVRYGAFAINVDTRKAKNFEDDLISVIKNNAIPTCWLLRKVLEEEVDYAAASKRLKSERVSAPVYYIVSGIKPNEGMVIEREVDSVHAFYELSDKVWYLVQTNYDRDEPEPVYDQRRHPFEKRMEERGQANFNVDTVLKEMLIWPTFNIATIMTAVITPAAGYHNTTAWYGYNPVPKQLSTA
jgi:acid ceramidase/N-acylethanolamine-hydrolysing acid amidase